MIRTTMTRSRSKSRLGTRIAGALGTAALVTSLAVATAGTSTADTTALTGDESVSVPTGSMVYVGQTPAQISSRLGSTYRLVDLHQAANGTYTMTAVRNSGAYAVPGWWYYYNRTPSQVSSLLSTNNARLISAERLSNGLLNVVMVANTGSAARTWWWYTGVSPATISSKLSANGARLVSLDADGNGSTYTAVMVKNAGSDAKSWWWYHGVSSSTVSSKLSANGARLVDLDRSPNGTFNVVMVKQTGTDNKFWKWYPATSITNAVNVARQTGYRIMDLQPFTSGSSTVYGAVLIDNLTAENRRVQNIFESGYKSSGLSGAKYGYYVKRIGSSSVLGLLNADKYEPASGIKALYNLYAERQVQLGNDGLGNSFAYWVKPDDTTNKDVCPLDYSNTDGNKVTTTLKDGLDRMMAVSDNRTTQGADLRYGRTNVNNYAAGIGMSGTLIKQTVGCGIKNGGFVTLTLNDITKMYEGVWNNTLLNTTREASFFGRMNGGAMPSTGPFGDMVREEAAKLGKTSSSSLFISQTKWRVKGGSYDMCFPTGDCSPPYNYVRSNAGVLTLPFKSSGAAAPRTYAFGWWVNNLKIPCSFGTACTAKNQADNTTAKFNPEIFRAQVRAALQTW